MFFENDVQDHDIGWNNKGHAYENQALSVRGVSDIMNHFPGYEESHEKEMRTYFRSLPEDHRRRYAAVEAQKIGFGGVSYIAKVLGISRQTIYTGIGELEEMCKDDSEHPQRPSGGADRIRRRGGGRRKEAGLERTAEMLLEAHSAGKG
jgi:hypothetical protein